MCKVGQAIDRAGSAKVCWRQDPGYFRGVDSYLPIPTLVENVVALGSKPDGSAWRIASNTRAWKTG
jgi:hypothetical protein